jgi:undecaprenyl diphosphate synthase
MQSKSGSKIHTAIIMDGNGRWAEKRGLCRSRGHDAGVRAVKEIVAAAPKYGIDMLTLFAISSDNLNRPAKEVRHLFYLVEHFLLRDLSQLTCNDIRLVVIGRRDRLPAGLAREIARVERATAHCQSLTVRIAVDYSARNALLAAFSRTTSPTRQALSEQLSGIGRICDVDLLIRTSGEQRLSDFLLWECAYAELYFASCDWPDFTHQDLSAAVKSFHQRARRFGKIENPTEYDAIAAN